MMPLYSILAAEEFMKALPYIAIAIGAVVLLVAFGIGFGKGWRRVGWGGLVWIVSLVAFFLVEKYLGEKILGFLKPGLSGMGLQEKEVAFASSFLTALACVLVVLLVYALFSAIFRPRMRWVPKKEAPTRRSPDGILYDDEYEDYDDYEDPNWNNELVRVGYSGPTFFGRLFGALICIVNVLTVVGAVGGTVLFALGTTSLKDGALSSFYSIEIVQKLMGYASRYAMDALFIGILVAFAYGGRKKGFLESLRGLIMGLGVFAAIVFCFYIPFSPWAAAEGGNYFLSTFTSRCVNAITSLGLEGTIGSVVGKLLAGLILAAFIVVVMLLLNWLLKKLVSVIENVGFLRVIDVTLSCLVFLVIGALICAIVWAVLYVLGLQGIFDTSELFTADSSLSQGIFDLFEIRLRPLIEQLGAQIKALFVK